MKATRSGILVLPLFLFLFCFFNIASLHAQTISSKNYTIQPGTTRWEILEPGTAAYTLVDFLGESSAQLFVRNGYVIQSGYRNRAEASKFTVSLDPPSIDYGIINNNLSITKDIKIRVAFPEVPGYTLSVSQDHPLTSPSGRNIPDTLCDDPRRFCTYHQAAEWTNPIVAGFGYRVSNPWSSEDFYSLNRYRPFTSTTQVDRPAPIIIRSFSSTMLGDQTTLTVKLQTLSGQSSDQYKHTITITALPIL